MHEPTEGGAPEAYINKISGVIASKVVYGDAGIAEIHVLADLSRHPKQLSRDIQSCVISVTGERIDHRVISIAQIEGPLAGAALADTDGAAAPERLKLAGIRIDIDGAVLSVTVKISSGDILYEGTHSTVYTPSKRQVAAAEAALAAINAVLADRGVGTPCLVLSEVQPVKLAGENAVAVALGCRSGRYGPLDLYGIAVNREDEYTAVTKAVLQAVNRVFPVL